MFITAAQLYDHVTCPRRVDLDAHGDQSERAEISAFVQMLWKRGSEHENLVAGTLPAGTVMLAGLPRRERAVRTEQALMAGAAVIYGGRIQADDLLGDPDLLLRKGDLYVAADIKSGRAEQDMDDDEVGSGRPKAHYAVQVSLYTDVLERMGASAGRRPEIWDVRGDAVVYDLDASRGPRTPGTWWDQYQATRDAVRSILAQPGSTRGALAAACGLCHWRDACTTELEALDDLTLIPMLGRAARDGMSGTIDTVAALAAVDPEAFVSGRKTMFPGVGVERLRTYHARAKLLSTEGAAAYLKSPIELPVSRTELFFDIEADPMRDLVYLHGFVERTDRDPSTERFTAFYADEPTREGEKKAFADAVAYMADRPEAAIFYYSKYERTMYRKLQRRFPDVCEAAVIEALFTPPRSIDLYCDVVMKATEWPTRNHSIKTLAKHLGFRWRDTDPSGAASIEWYHRWIESGDVAVRQRIIDYNEDDCRATAVLLDGIRNLTV